MIFATSAGHIGIVINNGCRPLQFGALNQNQLKESAITDCYAKVARKIYQIGMAQLGKYQIKSNMAQQLILPPLKNS